MSRKQALVDLLEYFQDRLGDLQQILSPQALERSGEPDDWSAKDNLFHALVWANTRLEMLETLQQGETWQEADHGDFSGINQEIFEKYRDRDWEELQDMIPDTYQRAAAYLDGITGEDLEIISADQRPYWRVLVDNLINHPMIHIWEILVKDGKIDALETMFGEHYGEMLARIDSSEDWQGGIHYNQACLLALSGALDRSLIRLEQALRANPRLIEWAKKDSDLTPLRNLPGYQRMFDQLENS